MTRSSSSKVSSMSRQQHLCSPVRSCDEVREWSQRVSRPLETRLGGQCRRECAGSLVAERKSGGRSEVDCAQYKFLRHEESTPGREVSHIVDGRKERRTLIAL